MDECIDLDNDNICGVCYAEFLDIDDLKLHIIQYHLNETSKYRFCDFCSRIFSDIEAYSLHLRNAHLSTFKTCKYCTRVFNDAQSVSRHEKKHKSSFYYPKIACSNCIKVFKNKKDLEYHEYEKHRDIDDGLMLQHCFPELSSLININIRKFFKGLHENYLYRCVVCELSTPNVTEYIDHLLKNECKSLSCNTCCNVYAWKSRLEHHCKTHKKRETDINNGKKQCPKCDKYFHFIKLKSHLKECSSMKCTPCDVSFDSVEKFAYHVTTHSHHSPVQFENCKYCRRPFIGLNALKKHIERSHKHNLHLYKYNCIYCNIVFKHPKLLFGHFFTKHRDINPYTCKICNTDYRIRKNFTLHIKLDHKSVGFVEFNSNYHVFFTDKKSEKPFQPRNLDIAESTNKESDNEMFTDNESDFKTMLNENKNESEKFGDTEKKTNDNINAIEQVSSKVESKANERDSDLEREKLEVTEEPKNKTTSVVNENTNERCELSENKPEDEAIYTNSNNKYNKPSVKLVNVNSDFMTVTETEADQTETEVKRKARVQKRKTKSQPIRSRKIQKTKTCDDSDSSDDSDVPLSKIVNKNPTRSRKRKIKRRKTSKETIQYSRKKMKFICFKCDRNCYTYQNYHRHMSLHMKKGHKTCVKCFEKFKTKDELNDHMKTEHSSSKLTETLKKLLDKRKSDREMTTAKHQTADTIISRTIQRVPFEVNDTQATITRVESDKISVKKFLETFKPDANDPTAKKISISNSLSIRSVEKGETKSFIKMTKFNSEPTVIADRPQLKMPVKFREEEKQEHKVTIKLVYCDYVTPTLNLGNEVGNTDFNKSVDRSYFEESYDSEVRNKSELIPEVGREVLLEDKDPTKVHNLKKTIVLKDLLSYNNVRIGHLAPKAPFYKIVKIDEVLHERQATVEPPKQTNITLPNGTKLVSVNPLAHLLGNKSVADIPKSNPYKNKSYSYKPKMQDFGQAIVKAMKVLDKTPAKRKSTKKIDPVN
nr:zinc finger protein 107-like [Vanessa tameamea]